MIDFLGIQIVSGDYQPGDLLEGERISAEQMTKPTGGAKKPLRRTKLSLRMRSCL